MGKGEALAEFLGEAVSTTTRSFLHPGVDRCKDGWSVVEQLSAAFVNLRDVVLSGLCVLNWKGNGVGLVAQLQGELLRCFRVSLLSKPGGMRGVLDSGSPGGELSTHPATVVREQEAQWLT